MHITPSSMKKGAAPALLKRPGGASSKIRLGARRGATRGLLRLHWCCGITPLVMIGALAEVRQQGQELRQLVDFIPQLIVVLDPNRHIRYANRPMLEFHGMSLEQYLAHDVESGYRVHPEDLDRYQQRRREGYRAARLGKRRVIEVTGGRR